jgi:energy-coupling factor transporter ATP-binding protein EcfA2
MNSTTHQLTRFQVIGLHGSRTMDVRLEENRLVLVGENGTGKSTFVNLLYYFLTKQWSRLRAYRFARLQAHFGDQELVLTPEHLEQHETQHRAYLRFARHLPPGVGQDVLNQLGLWWQEGSDTEDAMYVERLARERHLSSRAARNFIAEYVKKTKGKPTHIETLESRLTALVAGQFLYLPTYRRIEQDLRSIFRGVEIEAELRKFRERLGRRRGLPYIELVEFGMEDVEQTIAHRMAQTKESVRNGLDNLTGTYLRDVIRGVHTQIDVRSISEIDAKALEAVFERIDEATLPLSDKRILRGKVAAILEDHRLDEQDKVIAHFLSKLIELYAEQQANEKDVRDFVSLCNRYLTGKQMVYDNVKYAITIMRDGDTAREEGPRAQQQELEMKALSSGEKQIVSLFSHLHLSGEKTFFVVIDEPELSLSVPWQRRFLPDILGTGMCSGLVAVTHSPFVWENEMEPYVRALAECTVPYSPQVRG